MAACGPRWPPPLPARRPRRGRPGLRGEEGQRQHAPGLCLRLARLCPLVPTPGLRRRPARPAGVRAVPHGERGRERLGPGRRVDHRAPARRHYHPLPLGRHAAREPGPAHRGRHGPLAFCPRLIAGSFRPSRSSQSAQSKTSRSRHCQLAPSPHPKQGVKEDADRELGRLADPPALGQEERFLDRPLRVAQAFARRHPALRHPRENGQSRLRFIRPRALAARGRQRGPVPHRRDAAARTIPSGYD